MSTTSTSSTTEATTISRRSLLKAGAVGVAATATLGAVPALADEPAAAPADKPKRTRPTIMDLANVGPNADPIPPVAVPTAWDAQADVVIVGAGGGGLVACAWLAEQGLTTILIDKDAQVGGATRHGAAFVNRAGGSRCQEERGYFGFPNNTYDLDASTATVMANTNYSADPSLIRAMLAAGGPCLDWMNDHEEIPTFIGGGVMLSQAFVFGEKTR